MHINLHLLTALATLTTLSHTAYASTSHAPETTFAPADFERFSPQTALDMVREVPGFQIDSGDTDGRGLGQTSGNVLLNGERLTSKSTSTLDVLGRIPASRVERIEVLDGATLGIPGLSGRVVNVVAISGDMSGVWSYEARLRDRLQPRIGTGEVSISGQTGELEWTFGVENDAHRFGNHGPEFISDPNGALLERRDEDFQGQDDFLEGTLDLVWSRANGHEANLNASYSRFNHLRRLRGTRAPTMSDATYRVFRRGEDEWSSEISGDYAFPVLGGTLKLIGLHSHEDSRFNNVVTRRNADDLAYLNGVRLEDDFIENEAIGRVEFGWQTDQANDWQIAGETAYNRLDAGNSFFDVDSDGQPTLNSRATPTLVEENRYEVSFTHGRTLTPRLSLQASLAAEYSEITSRVGIDQRAQDFIRPKGYVSATYDWNDTTDITLRIEREVGQLDFFDFVASEDINNGNNSAANRDLVPDQSWAFEAEIDRNFGAFGAVEISLSHEEIEDHIDRVPIGNTGQDGPGNIDSAHRSRAEIDGTFNLDPFGLEGVQLEVEGVVGRSRFDDPLTSESRRISEDRISFVFAEVRWDIPSTDFALSVAGEQGRRARNYRLDELFQYSSSRPFMWATVEHKDFFGSNAYITLGNLLDSSDQEQRVRFTPDRRGTISEIREFDRSFGYILTFGLSGSF